MHAAPKAKDCWEGHRPHAILTARTARLLRSTPASCAGRWAAGWATATTSMASNQCGEAVRGRRWRRRWVVAAAVTASWRAAGGGYNNAAAARNGGMLRRREGQGRAGRAGQAGQGRAAREQVERLCCMCVAQHAERRGCTCTGPRQQTRRRRLIENITITSTRRWRSSVSQGGSQSAHPIYLHI